MCHLSWGILKDPGIAEGDWRSVSKVMVSRVEKVQPCVDGPDQGLFAEIGRVTLVLLRIWRPPRYRRRQGPVETRRAWGAFVHSGRKVNHQTARHLKCSDNDA